MKQETGPSRRRQLLVLVGALLVLLGVWWWWSRWQTPAPPELSPNVGRLLNLMSRRLEIMPEVAKTKWRQHRPIADPRREEQLLDALVNKAKERDIDPEFVRTFFSAQIEAGKRVQQSLFERWESVGAPVGAALDLADLRRQLDAIGQQMLLILPAAQDALADEQQRTLMIQRARSIFTGPGIDNEVQDLALKPLLEGN